MLLLLVSFTRSLLQILSGLISRTSKLLGLDVQSLSSQEQDLFTALEDGMERNRLIRSSSLTWEDLYPNRTRVEQVLRYLR